MVIDFEDSHIKTVANIMGLSNIIQSGTIFHIQRSRGELENLKNNNNKKENVEKNPVKKTEKEQLEIREEKQQK